MCLRKIGMNSKLKSIFKAGGLVSSLCIGLIVGILFFSGMNTTMTYIAPKSWHLIASASEGNPGAGSSGFLEIFFTNHTASPDTAYNENTSATMEAWCVANMVGHTPYATADAFKTEISYGVTFDIVVRCRFNKTNAWDGAKFIDKNCRVNITLTGFGTAGMVNITGTQVITYNNTGATYLYTNTFWQDVDGGTGTGFTVLKGTPYTSNKIVMINIWAKY
jgi:hypothetical protein